MEDRTLNILYGDKGYKLNLNSHWNPNIIRKPQMPIISNLDKKIEEIFEKPKDSSNIESLAKLAKSVCILVCDITRPVPNKLFIETLINKLIKYGINKDKILILIATGLHRPATKNEINQIIGSNWVDKNISIKNHYARDDNMHSNLGVTTKNNVIKLDKRFLQSDLKIATGLVEPHFMAGYSGGRKIIAPGIAHAETITRFHSAKYMENKYSKSCNLYKNPLHEDQLEIVKMIGDVYAVNCVIDENRELSFINFGEIIQGKDKNIEFIIQNTGTGDLMIANAKADCGCTTLDSDYPKIIKPDSTGKISVTFNSNNIGEQRKNIRLTTNTTPNIKILTIEGIVLPSKN